MGQRPSSSPQPRQSPTQQAIKQAEEMAFDKGLPTDINAERFCLGIILLNDNHFEAIAEYIDQEDLALEKHRRIWAAIKALRERGDRCDRVTLADELTKRGWLESCDGISYIVSLDDGLPEISHPESYAKIVAEKSRLRKLIFTGQSLINRALGNSESAEVISAGAIESIQRIEGVRVDDDGKTPTQIIDSFSGGISEFMDPSLRKRGLPTGFTKLDEMLGGGLQDGELMILAGRPSSGKSALAINIVSHLCLSPMQRRSCVIFSLETNGAHILTRMMCAAARVDSHKFRSGYLNADERRKLQVILADIIDSRLRVYEFGISLPQIEKASRRLVKDEGCQLVVIDYLTLVASHGKSENRNLEVGAMTRTLKLLAKDLGIPFLVLAQLSRANEKRTGDKVPILSDLRESGEIEQNADTVAFIHRPEVYKRDEESLKGLAELYLAKQRNGPIGKIDLSWISHYTRFENRTNWGDMPEEG